jgi:hypothetical protein
MPFKSEIRPVRGYSGAEVGENPYLTPNTLFFPKATLPQRGRVEVKNRPDQVRTKPGPTQVAQALIALLFNTRGAPREDLLNIS